MKIIHVMHSSGMGVEPVIKIINNGRNGDFT